MAERKPVAEISDRAKRYRANKIHRLRSRCEECRSKRNLGVGHRDGDESNNRPSNLFTQCKSCNGIQAARDKRLGRGVRTRQYNSSGSSISKKRRNAGAGNLAQYVQAAVDHTRGSHDAGGKVIHETPKSKRKEFAREIAFRKGYRNPRGRAAGELEVADKDPHTEVDYEPKSKHLPDKCATCAHFIEGKPPRCFTVKSPISPGAYCERFESAAARKNPRRNPQSEADALYKKFHGRGPDKIYELQVAGVDPYGGHPELASLGPLIRFIVGEGVVLGGEYGDEVQEAEWVREILFVPSVARWHEWLERTDPPIAEAKARLREYKVPDLAAVPNTKQLYIVGGNQNLDAQLTALGGDPEKDLQDLGFVFMVEYFTQKRFDHFEPVNYWHHFSEVSKEQWPRLIYSKSAHLLSLAGGAYTVKAAGITN